MERAIRGLHHVTAIAGDAQTNVDFYAGLLGLRLVKRTVNFDDPGTYHLYYGNAEGRPGTILTFFPWPQARRGSRGTGQAVAVALSAPAGSLGYWHDRLRSQGVVVEGPAERFAQEVLTLLDPDGLKLELVAHDGADELPPWTGGSVPERHALRGLHGVTLSEERAGPTASFLAEVLGLERRGRAGGRERLAGTARVGSIVDLVESAGAGRGRISAGTIHHVAWRAADEAEQEAWRSSLGELELGVTPVLDRRYFRSIYFREPGGVLFEIATDPPGFTADEPLAELGQGLKLPPWLEPVRDQIERALPPLRLTAPGETAGGPR